MWTFILSIICPILTKLTTHVLNVIVYNYDKDDDNTYEKNWFIPLFLSIIFILISEDEEDNENEIEDGIIDKKRKREKLTRAQLNKRKKRNIASHEEFKKRDEKDLLKSLDSLPRVIKGIEAEEKRLEDMKIIREVVYFPLFFPFLSFSPLFSCFFIQYSKSFFLPCLLSSTSLFIYSLLQPSCFLCRFWFS